MENTDKEKKVKTWYYLNNIQIIFKYYLNYI